MVRYKKYFFPIAIVKILLVFLILQLFFSSCDNEVYDSEINSDGPLVEIEASFGNELNVFRPQDTVYLTITIDSPVFVNEATGDDVILNDAQYSVRFAFRNDNGDFIFPQTISQVGEIQSVGQEFHTAHFGLIDKEKNKSTTIYSPASLRLGFVFTDEGHYTFYFENIPSKSSDSSIDVFYNKSPEASEYSIAYAVYLFDSEVDKTYNYSLAFNNPEEQVLKEDILSYAECDQAILDFTVSN